MSSITRAIQTAILIGSGVFLAGAVPASAQPYYALESYGGPVLETFKIYPLYLGGWTAAEIGAHQAYLKSLASFISGVSAPSGQQPGLRQYGVDSASVAASKTAPAPKGSKSVTQDQLVALIQQYQQAPSPKLPPFGPNTLIAVFLPPGFSNAGCNGCSYHASIENGQYWLVVPRYTNSDGSFDAAYTELVTAHEVFEAATDPMVDTSSSWGWLTGPYYPAGSSSPANDEIVDECGATGTINLTNLGIVIPAFEDNTGGITAGKPAQNQPPGGTCSTTGYTSLDEIQVYGWTYANYRAKYNTLWPEGWRLYSLQSYVLSTGAVLYNAVWRLQPNTSEIQDYGVSFSRFKSDYDTLYPEGWRIYILQSYVLPNGTVLYNAVWRPGDVAETQVYGVTYDAFRSQYNTLYPEGWRVNILQTYVLPNGDTLYNAVWRQGSNGEMQVYGWTYADYRNLYNTLFPEGWRLYILDSYVPGGTVLYNAVWRPATHPEKQLYGAAYAAYRKEYNTLFAEGWRLYSLTAYVLPGDVVTYDAVWREGTIDRPL